MGMPKGWWWSGIRRAYLLPSVTVRNPKSAIPQSAIHSPQFRSSQFRSSQSTVRNPQSAIRNPQFRNAYLRILLPEKQ